MFEWIKNLFGDPNQRALDKLWPIVDEVNEHFEELKDLSDEELRAKTDEFKEEIQAATTEIDADIDELEERLRLARDAEGTPAAGPRGDGAPATDAQAQLAVSENGEAAPAEALSLQERQDLYDELDALEEERYDVVQDTLDRLLPEAFAVVKETCRRHLGETWQAGGSEIEWDMVPYDVQILGGIVLHDGDIAEMKTGEGKTLAAVMPVYLNALTGRGVHLITVNPYLAERDAEWMGPIYRFHGLTVDVVNRYDPHTEGRRGAYEADITYGTNNEFGFDYLRDNSFVVKPDQLVQREHAFAIIDEIDSVLIDEARTPLIISGPVPEQQSNDQYAELQPSIEKVVRQQKRLVENFAQKAEELLEKRDEAQADGDKKEARRLADEAGLALLRASRGFPKNDTFRRLMEDASNERLLQKTESFYLQENAKRMPEVDAELLYHLDEKKHSIEMTEKGRAYTAKVSGEDEEMFVLPNLGDRQTDIDIEYDEKIEARKEELKNDDSLSEEKRQNKIMNDERELEKEREEARRELYSTYSERAERLHAIEQLLKAYSLYEKDTEYIIQDGKVQIVDEHTGRVLEGRRYSQGLHQAIEAKEQVEVQQATQTYAKITLQNYFRMYDKLAGMTGTAETEAEEFDDIYDMHVIVVPTNEPVIRDDKDDLLFKTRREKYDAIIEKVQEYNDRGQPVLVGTTSVDVSEVLSRRLEREGISHNVLNAKKDRAKKESEIVAEAGQPGAVTIATNMAGRGTDIKLGEGVVEKGGLAIIGSERHESRRIDLQLRGRSGRQGDPGESQFYVSLDDDLMRLFGSERMAKVMNGLGVEEGEVITHPWMNKAISRAQGKVEKNHFSVRKRQLEYDDVLNSQREVIYTRRGEALTGKRFHGEILGMLQEQVDDIVGRYYPEGDLEGMREELLRTLAFDFEISREEVAELGEDGLADRIFNEASAYYQRKRQAIAQPFYQSIRQLEEQAAAVPAGDDGPSEEEGDAAPQRPERVYVDFSDGNRLLRAVVDIDEVIETEGKVLADALERQAMLTIIDEHWTDHLRELDEVKEGIGLRSFGRRDPAVEYKMEAYELFEDMMHEITGEVVSTVFKAGPLVEDEQGRARKAEIDLEAARKSGGPQSRLDSGRARAEHETAEPSYGVDANGQGQKNEAADRDPSSGQETVVVGEKVGRNDPCPCGSGRKYKKCCGRPG
ncbi:MAG: preprotein translocase subunit SecA [Bacteroidetes bacterium QH_8_67_23]|nr:MAG: preprotein translocase subunit SecA [Bacteroidetes bacterium QH_8_67_23]